MNQEFNLGMAVAIEAAVKQNKQELAADLLHRAAKKFCNDEPPDFNWFRDYYSLTGDHMILTEEGWCNGRDKSPEIEVLEEVNAPTACDSPR